MAAIEEIGRDVFMRHTDVNGKKRVQQHRVWDMERFTASLDRDTKKMNADQPEGGSRKAAFEQITEEQFRKENQRGH